MLFTTYPQGACVALVLVALLAGCHKTPTPAPAVAPSAAAPVAAPSTVTANSPLEKAKQRTATERRAFLAQSAWAKEAVLYGELMEKAVATGQTISDPEAIALDQNLRQAHQALRVVSGKEFTDVLLTLRIEKAGDEEKQAAFGKFSMRMRTLRRPNNGRAGEVENRRVFMLDQASKEHTVTNNDAVVPTGG